MRAWLKWVLGIAVVALAGGTIYAWGAGWFWPCETIGRIFSAGRCTHLMTDGLGAAAKLPNGNLLVALSSAEGDADNTVRLVEIPAGGGTPISQTTLPANEFETRVAGMAVSKDGNTVALHVSFDEGHQRWATRIFSRDGTLLVDDLPGLPGYMAFDDAGRFLMHPGNVLGQLPEAGRAQAFDLADPDNPQPVTPLETRELFSKGLNSVFSADGDYSAQLLDYLNESRVVGVRLRSLQTPDYPGLLLGASLGSDCNYMLSDMAFSPDNTRLAAEFECPDEWGRVVSALVVWDYIDKKPVLTVPTINWFSEPFWLDDDTIIVTRHNFVRGGSELLSIKVPETR